MGKIIEIREHDGPKNKSERIITKDVSCYYKMRQPIDWKTKTFIKKGASIKNETTVLQNETGISIQGVYYTTGNLVFLINLISFKKLIMRIQDY